MKKITKSYEDYPLICSLMELHYDHRGDIVHTEERKSIRQLLNAELLNIETKLTEEEILKIEDLILYNEAECERESFINGFLVAVEILKGGGLM